MGEFSVLKARKIQGEFPENSFELGVRDMSYPQLDT